MIWRYRYDEDLHQWQIFDTENYWCIEIRLGYKYFIREDFYEIGKN